MMMFKFTDFFRELVGKYGTQEAFAVKLNVGKRAVGHWVQGGPIDDKFLVAIERMEGLPDRRLVAFKYLNTLERLGFDMNEVLNPEILQHYGVKTEPLRKSSLSRDQIIASELVGAGDYTGLMSWALKTIEQQHNSGAPSTSDQSSPSSPRKKAR